MIAQERSGERHGQEERRGLARGYPRRPGRREDLRGCGRLAQRSHRSDSAAGEDAVGPRETRGDGGVCRRRGSAPDGTIGRLRREQRSRQPAPDQRTLRLSPEPRSRGRHRGADSERRDRERLFPGDPSRVSLRPVQPLLRAGVPARADAARARDRHSDGAVAARGVGHRPARRRGIARGRRAGAAPALSRAEALRVPLRGGDCGAGEDSERVDEDDDPRRRGLCGRARGADRPRGQAEGADRARDARARSSSSTTTRSTSA